jgi:hypothetical protein
VDIVGLVCLAVADADGKRSTDTPTRMDQPQAAKPAKPARTEGCA